MKFFAFLIWHKSLLFFCTAKQWLYKKVFQFVFGPEEEKPDPLRAQMLCSNLIKAKRGTLCVEDWMLVSGNDREKAESEMAKFTAIFDGKAEITSDGQLIYSFPELMRSQSGNRALNTPNFTWKEPIAKKEFTGNSTGANVGIGFLNGFNLMAVVFKPEFHFNRGCQQVIKIIYGRRTPEPAGSRSCQRRTPDPARSDEER